MRWYKELLNSELFIKTGYYPLVGGSTQSGSLAFVFGYSLRVSKADSSGISLGLFPRLGGHRILASIANGLVVVPGRRRALEIGVGIGVSYMGTMGSA
jgi:hypothetical protein